MRGCRGWLTGISGIESIGVDEIQRHSGHTHLTLVYQTTGVKRPIWVSHNRTEQSLRRFFESATDLKSRWCLLKRPDNLTDDHATRRAELSQYNFKSVRAHLVREKFW